jgi:hypothetical protein
MLKEKMEQSGIRKALQELGYDYEAIFGNLTPEQERIYASYSWQKVICMKDGIRAHYVIHGVPSEELLESYPWEEWFFRFNEPHHHVLFTKKQDCCDKEIFISQDDQEHPKEICGRTWYYYEDGSSDPYLHRSKK